MLQISKEHVRARTLLQKARQYKDKKEQGARYAAARHFFFVKKIYRIAKAFIFIVYYRYQRLEARQKFYRAFY